jgi:hypothetical protein
LKQAVNVNNYFTHDWLESWTSTRAMNEHDPVIFMIGFPRSGTTLLDQMLDSHPGIQVVEEKPLIENIVSKLSDTDLLYPKLIASLNKEQIDELRKEYLRNLDKYIEKRNNSIVIDKLPLNIVHVGLIYRMFPQAKYIMTLRHPNDVCLSNFMQHYKMNSAMANFSSLAKTSELYDSIMLLWQKYVELLPLNFTEIRYELLVDETETEIRKLLGFLEVNWDPAILDYANHAKSKEAINTPSYSQVTEPIYHSARYRWQCYEEYLRPVLNKLESHINYFGY